MRYLVEESLARYVSFMESCCSIAVTVESPNSVTADRVVKVPLLTLEMQVVNDVVGFVQAPELFKSKTLLAFDSALQRLQVCFHGWLFGTARRLSNAPYRRSCAMSLHVCHSLALCST